MWTQENKPNEHVPFMNTLTSCVNKAVQDGYIDNFKVEKNSLHSSRKEKDYTPADITVKNFYRFEGQSDPADNAIMYTIETTDGAKGILIDAYGTYADDSVNKFMEQVEEINKKVQKS